MLSKQRIVQSSSVTTTNRNSSPNKKVEVIKTGVDKLVNSSAQKATVEENKGEKNDVARDEIIQSQYNASPKLALTSINNHHKTITL